MAIKAIETRYNGYRFRSRLEARWAVFFDRLEISYDYEPEGFDLGDGLFYLPDFFLRNHEAFVEIKPNRIEHGSDADAKINGFIWGDLGNGNLFRDGRSSSRPIYELVGSPRVYIPDGIPGKGSPVPEISPYRIHLADCTSGSCGDWHESAAWCECTTCGFQNFISRTFSKCLQCKANQFELARVETSAATACSYRFGRIA